MKDQLAHQTKHKRTHPLVRCLIPGCKRITTDKSIGPHLGTEHNQGQKLGINYKYLDGRARRRSGPKPQGLKKTQKQVVGYNSEYINVPVVLQIPIAWGAIKIIAAQG